MSEQAKKSDAPTIDQDRSEAKPNTLLFNTLLLLGWEVCKFAAGAFSKILVGDGPRRVPTTPAEPAVPASGRSADRNVGQHAGIHLGSGTLMVLFAFALALLGGAGFLFAYWSGGSNELLGANLALFLAGVGAALVFYSHALMAHREAVELREELASNLEDREAVLQDLRAAGLEVQRRSLLQWIIAGTGVVVAAGIISLLRSLGEPPGPSLFTTIWKRGQRLMTADGKPVAVDSLQPGSSITVFPEGSIGAEEAQTVLLRVKQESLQLPAERSHWAPQGYIAYSRVCTHAGCPVGLFEAESDLLLCPCHQSTFDVLRGAQPTSGPAARPLPQLPLYADVDGTLRAGGGFSVPPGPGFWGMP